MTASPLARADGGGYDLSRSAAPGEEGGAENRAGDGLIMTALFTAGELKAAAAGCTTDQTYAEYAPKLTNSPHRNYIYDR